MSQYDKISGIIVDGDSILNWHNKVSQKYSKLPGIRELHDFLIVRNPTTNNAMMLVHEFCHEGAAKPTTLSLSCGVSSEFYCCPGPSETYHQLVKTRVLQSTKLAHIQQICSSYVPSNLEIALRILGILDCTDNPWIVQHVCVISRLRNTCAISRLRKPSVRNLKIACACTPDSE